MYTTLYLLLMTLCNIHFTSALPLVSLANDCFKCIDHEEGLPKPGLFYSCVCYLTNVGYPPGQIGWFYENGLSVGYRINSTAAVLSIDLAADKSVYFCRGLSGLDATKITIKPNEACKYVRKTTTLSMFCPPRVYVYRFSVIWQIGQTDISLAQCSPVCYVSFPCIAHQFNSSGHFVQVQLQPYEVEQISSTSKLTCVYDNIYVTYFVNFFDLPNATIARECYNSNDIINGYIRPNTAVSCPCVISQGSKLSVRISWYDSSGREVGEKLNGSASILHIVPVNNGMKYQCKVSTSLFDGVNILWYNVTYAKSPTSCTIGPDGVVNDTSWDICRGDTITHKFTCSVPNASDLPGVNATFYVNYVSQYVEKYFMENNYYKFQANLTLTNMNKVNVTCTALNARFSEITTSCFYIFNTRSPPKDSPTMLIHLNETTVDQDVVENTTYMLNCSVYGGTPPVCNMTVSCGNISRSTKSGNIFTSSLIFTRHMTGMTCTCAAQHVTGASCYENNVIQKKLNILYPAGIERFGTFVDTKILDNGTLLNLTCRAVGNPAPEISIYKGQVGLANNYKNISVKQAIYEKLTSCKDTGVYTCVANNTGYTATQSLILYVNCPMQFNNLNESNRVITTTKGALFSADILIYGFPYASEFYLFKYKVDTKSNIKILLNQEKLDSGLENLQSNRKFKRDVDATFNALDFAVYKNTSHGISLDYRHDEPPYSVVNFTMHLQDGSDFTNYSLYIIQPTEEKTEFLFTINEITAESNVAEIIGGTVAAVVVFFACIIGFLLIRRRYKGTSCRKQEKDMKKSNYSHMADKLAPDSHPYETTIIGTKSKLNIDIYKDKRYVNVEYDRNVHIIPEDTHKDVVLSDPKQVISKQTQPTMLHPKPTILTDDKKENSYDTIDVKGNITNQGKIFRVVTEKKSIKPDKVMKRVSIINHVCSEDEPNDHYDIIDVVDDKKPKRTVHIISEDKTYALVQLSHGSAQAEVNRNLTNSIHQYDEVEIAP